MRKSADIDVTERLMRSAGQSMHNNMHAREEYQRQLEKEAPFHPQVNPVSEKIVEGSAMFQGENKDFLARQRAYEQRKRENQQEQNQREAKQQQHRPKISGVSEILISSMPSRASESFVERIERLSYGDKQHLDQMRKSLQDEYYSQFKFKPNINKISSIIASAQNHEELYRNDKNRRLKEQLNAAAEEQFRKEHTFHPKLSKTTEDIASKLNTSRIPVEAPEMILSKIEQEREAKERKLEEMRKSKEYEQMKECTFQPKIVHKPKLPSGPVPVCGLERHLELSNMARQKQEEQRKREEQVFNMHPRSPTHPYTIPEPFPLSSDPHSHIKKARLKQEQMAKELQECTFKPVTNWAHDKMALGEILGSPNRSVTA